MYSVIYPPTVNYDWMFQRPQQLMRQFGRLGWKALYINAPAPKSRLTGPAVERREDNLYILNRENPRNHTEGKVIYFFSCPQHVQHVGAFREEVIVFDNLDEPTEQFKLWAPWYERALSTANIVTCTSEKLYNNALRLNKHTILVPNAADFDYFAQAQSRTSLMPEDIAHLQGKQIIGYYGALSDWVDWELITELADNLPENTQLVLIGPLYNISQIPEHSRITYAGLKEYKELYKYLQYFDTAIIPFKVTSMTESCSPIKLWEYLSSGVPVVATAIPEAMRHPEISIGKTPREFIEQVKLALNDKDIEKKNARIKLAQANSWEVRAKQIMEAVENYFINSVI